METKLNLGNNSPSIRLRTMQILLKKNKIAWAESEFLIDLMFILVFYFLLFPKTIYFHCAIDFLLKLMHSHRILY